MVDVPGLPSAAGKASIADRSPSRKLHGSEGQKVRLRQYTRKVDQALRGVLTGLAGGDVLAIRKADVPEGAPVAAIFR